MSHITFNVTRMSRYLRNALRLSPATLIAAVLIAIQLYSHYTSNNYSEVIFAIFGIVGCLALMVIASIWGGNWHKVCRNHSLWEIMPDYSIGPKLGIITWMAEEFYKKKISKLIWVSLLPTIPTCIGLIYLGEKRFIELSNIGYQHFYNIEFVLPMFTIIWILAFCYILISGASAYMERNDASQSF